MKYGKCSKLIQLINQTLYIILLDSEFAPKTKGESSQLKIISEIYSKTKALHLKLRYGTKTVTNEFSFSV